MVNSSDSRLIWQEQVLDKNCVVPMVSMQRSESLQLVCPERCQHQLLKNWCAPQGRTAMRVMAGEHELKGLGRSIGVIMNGHSLLANLTIKENIMLPFLYHFNSSDRYDIEKRLQQAAGMFGLDEILYQQAGMRSPLIHGLVALCRAALQQAQFIILQQPCVSMDVREAETFSVLAKETITTLDAGMLYLTTSVKDQGGFSFTKQLDCQRVP